MFLLKAEKAQLSLESGELLVSGAQNIYTCKFTFSDDWNNITPTVVFRTHCAKVSVLPDPYGSCKIPHEVLKVPQQDLQVGIYGTKNGELVMPTLWTSLGKILVGTTLGEDAALPEAAIYDQILATANRAAQIAQSVREDADNGLLGGGSGSGTKGEPARLISQEVVYQMSDSGTLCPTGAWAGSIPLTPQGKYLWTRTTLVFNSGDPVVSYSVARMGLDGTGGSVTAVNHVEPDADGNVTLTASDVKAMPAAGGNFTGPVNMNGQTLSGLNDPVKDTDAAGKGYVDRKVQTYTHQNLLDNWFFRNPVNQRGVSGVITEAGYFIDRWKLTRGKAELTANGLVLNGTMVQILEFAAGKNVQASVLTTTGLMDGNYDDSSKTFTITGTGQTIVAAKLELGDVQTLAHQASSGEWVLNEIPNYGEQLTRCQRYYRILSKNMGFRSFIISANTIQAMFPVNPPMRTAPSIASLNLEVRSLESITATGFEFSVNTSSESFVRILAKKTSHGLTDGSIFVTSNIIMTADL